MASMQEPEVYPNAPVVLVALEVRHPTADPLTHAQRLKIKRQLAAYIPIMRTGQLAQITAVQAAGVSPAPQDMRVEEFPRYFSRDNTIAVSVRTDGLVVETTRYVRWERLRELAAEVFEVRQDLGGVDGVERVGLRYINEIRVPGEPVHDWAPWVDATLLGATPIGEELGLTALQWQGITVLRPGPERSLVLRYGPWDGFAVDPAGELKRSTPTPGFFFLLDIDSFWTPSEGIPEFDAKALLATSDELHAPVRKLFERLVTDRLRREVFRHSD